MSTTVDNKIVEMRFDNEQFEKGVAHTSSLLDRFKEKLQFNNEQANFKNLEKTANKISFDPLGNAIDAVSVKFNMLDNLMWNGLSRISNKILDVGENLVKSLSVDNISSGWQKYIDKTASVQTILNSTDLTTSQVDEYLSKLMWYSDQTSYSFNDMTAALGQMLTMGGDIDTLIPMIEGMANAVAFAGKGGEAFSSVLRNIKQSYAGGYLTRLDWGSFDTFGVSSIALKEALIQAGEELGTIEKGQITLENFTETLTVAKWATTDVMEKAFVGFASFTDAVREAMDNGEFESVDEAMEALMADYDDIAVKSFYAGQKAKSFTEAIDATKDAVSTGWMTTLQYVFGDYDEAIELWTNFCNYLWDIFASSAEGRNEVFANWKDMGGRDELIKSFENILQSILSIKDAISGAFVEMFGWATGDGGEKDFIGAASNKLMELTKRFERFTFGIKPSEETLDKIQRITKGVIAVFDILGEILSSIFRNVLPPVLDALGIVGGGLFDVSANVGDTLVAFRDWVKEAHPFEQTFVGVGNVLASLIETIKKLLNWVGELPIIRDVADWIKSAFNVEEASKGLPKLQLDFESVCNNIGSFFSDLWSKISEFFSNLIFGGEKTSEETTAAFNDVSAVGIQGVFENIVSSVGTFITDVFAKIKTFVSDAIDSIKNGTESGWEEIKTLGSTIWEKITGFFSNAINGISNVVSKIKPAGEKIGGVIGTIIGFIGDIVNGVFNFFKNLNPFKVSLLVIIGIIASLFFVLTSAANLLKSLTGSIDEVIEPIKKVGKSATTFLNAEAFLAMAKGLALIIGAMVVLALLPTEKIITAGIVISVVFGVIAAIITSLNKYSGTLATGGANAAKTVGLMLSMAVSLALLAAAFGIITLIVKNINDTELGESFLMLFGLLSLVIVSLYLVSKLPVQSASNASQTILGVAASVIVLAIAFKMIVNTVNSVDATTLSLSFTILFGLVSSVILLITLMALLDTNRIGTASGAILEVSGAIMILVIAMKIIATMPAEQLETGLSVISGFLIGVLIVLSALSNMQTSTAGPGLAILAISASLILLIMAVKLASKLSDDVPAAIVGLTIVGVLLAIIVVVFKTLGDTEFGKNVAKAGIAIALVSVAIGILTICIGLLSGLAKENLEGTLVATGIIELILITMSGVLLALSKNKNIGSAVPALIVLAVIIGLIGGVLITLAALDPENALAILGGLALVFVSLAIVLATIPYVNNGTSALAPLIALTLVIASIGAVLILLGTITDPTTILPICAGLSMVMLSLAVVLAVLSDSGPLSPTVLLKALIAVGIAAILIDGLGVIFITLGALGHQLDPSGEAMERAVKMLTQFGEGIGGFIGGLFTGFGEAVINLFINLITKLTETIVKSVEDLSAVSENGKQAAEMLLIFSGALLALGAAELVSGLSNLVSTIFSGGENPIVSACKKLVEAAPYINEFCESTAGLTVDDAKKASLFADVIGSIANAMPSTGEWLNAIFGEKKSLSDFAAELALMGPLLRAFAFSVKGLNVDDVEAATNAAKMIADVQKALPSYGGKLQTWFGEQQTLGKFAKMLIPFGEGMKGFAEVIDGVTLDNVEQSASAAKMLAEMETTLPDSGGVLQYWVGEKQTMAEFARQLPLLGTELKEFADNAAGLKQEDAEKAIAVAEMLSALEDNLPDHGGIIKDWFTGDATLASFGQNLVDFGSKIWEFQSKITGLDLSTISKFTDILNALVQSAVTVSVNKVSGLSDFASELIAFADSGFTDFVKKATDAIVSSVTDNDQAYQDAGALIVEFMSYGLYDPEAEKNLNMGINSMVSLLINISDKNENVTKETKVGQTILERIGDGIASSSSKKYFESKIKEIFNSFASITKGYKAKWEEAGKNLTDGLKTGIEKGKNSAIEACANLAKKMEEEIRKQWDEHSPSKVAARDGSNFTKGLLNGLTQNSDSITKAGRSLANSVRDAVSYAMDLAQNSDLSPTITPVIDFGQLNRDMGQLSGLNGFTTFGITSRFGNIDDKTKQNINVYARSDNQDVVDSISKLQNGIETLGDKMSKLQVKMDTGALVGEIINPIDKSLGIRAARSLRERSR